MKTDIFTWADVKERLAPLGRGAAYRLSKAISMNSSFLYRKLRTRDELTTGQRHGVLVFLDEKQDGPPAIRAEAHQGLIPIFGYAAMGEDLIALNEGQVLDWMRLPMGISVGPGEWFVVTGVGSSMEPRIFPGDLLLVRRKHPPSRGKDALIEFYDGSGVIKTYEGERQGRVYARQWNEPQLLDYDASRVKAVHGGIVKL